MSADLPNILILVTDQQRADTIHALGNADIDTPNIDRLVARGVSFTNAYSPVPVCVAARWTLMTGRDAPTTRYFSNVASAPVDGQPEAIFDRCGPALPARLAEAGYRTFGIGKFHTTPRNLPLGFEFQVYGEDMHYSPAQRRADDYASWVAERHPAYEFVEDFMGQRTSMYYVPQASQLPMEAGVEWWAAEHAVEHVALDDGRPFFGYVSFIGPHPPFAPPTPFNRIYDPEALPSPTLGDVQASAVDEHIGWMNHYIWADDIGEALAQNLKAHYYGEISYIDHCIGRVLDAVEARADAEDTLICFVSDHGELLGDHGGWQKESFLEGSARVPFLVSWPAQLSAGRSETHLVSLVDVFGLATGAAGGAEPRDGIDLLAALGGAGRWRERLVCCYGEPGTAHFKLMVREGRWKYLFFANGGAEQLFDLSDDPGEQHPLESTNSSTTVRLRQIAVDHLQRTGLRAAATPEGFLTLPREERDLTRVRQFDRSRGVSDFAGTVEQALATYSPPLLGSEER